MSTSKQPKILIIAGSDSSGGAGIQADIKTITILGGFAMTAVTALTVQNTEGVQDVFPVPGEFVSRQMIAVLDDIGTDAIKIGMLANTDVIDAVAEVFVSLAKKPIVVLDPVIMAQSGQPLLEAKARDALKQKLLPLADVITPNVPEAEALSGQKITSVRDMKTAATALLTVGPKAVLVTGGHLEGDTISDVLVTPDTEVIFESARLKTDHTHGTGCTLASAIAFELASGLSLEKSVAMAREYVLKALRCAPRFGKGNGPLGHNLID